jgi:hypothetical protein
VDPAYAVGDALQPDEPLLIHVDSEAKDLISSDSSDSDSPPQVNQ